MLTALSLRDFVIVESLSLDVRRGFTVLTGETGAGKSILIDALQLILGGRADAGVVREGAERTNIVAEFQPPESARKWLLGHEVEKGGSRQGTLPRLGERRLGGGFPAEGTRRNAH